MVDTPLCGVPLVARNFDWRACCCSTSPLRRRVISLSCVEHFFSTPLKPQNDSTRALTRVLPDTFGNGEREREIWFERIMVSGEHPCVRRSSCLPPCLCAQRRFLSVVSQIKCSPTRRLHGRRVSDATYARSGNRSTTILTRSWTWDADSLKSFCSSSVSLNSTIFSTPPAPSMAGTPTKSPLAPKCPSQ
jgi:hypothetical protein